jgi:hypothetical protein
LWNPEATVRKLAFGVENADGEDEEDNYSFMCIQKFPRTALFVRSKWCKNMDLDILSPMYDAAVRHYYVNEVA